MWGRLRSFHRVALAITLAMVVVVVARKHVIDPLKGEVAEAKKSLEENEVPETVTLPEEDVEIQETELKVESLEERLPEYQAELKKAMESWPKFSKADKGKILAEFNDLIAQSGLTQLEFREGAIPLETEEDPKRSARRTRRPAVEKASEEASAASKTSEPMETAIHSYVLTGTFADVRAFLAKIDKFSYPARIEDPRLQLAELASEDDADAPAPVRINAAPQLRLSFRLKLYFHD